MYEIKVVATGNYTNQLQPVDDKTAEIFVMKPVTTNTTIGGGTLVSEAAAGRYSGDTSEEVAFSVGLQYTKSGANLQGKAALAIPQADGSIVYVKSNSISSMKVTGATDKTSTIYTKASIYRVDDGTVATIEGNVTLRVDVVDVAGGSTGDEVGFTVLSSKSSELFYSNRWVYDSGKKVWQTKTQAFTGIINVR